jgi:hypothetical protein
VCGGLHQNAALSPVAKWQLCGGKVSPAPVSDALPDSFHAPVTQLSRAEIIFYYEAWGFELCGIGGGWAGSIATLSERFGNGHPIVAAGRLNALLTERINLYLKSKVDRRRD